MEETATFSRCQFLFRGIHAQCLKKVRIWPACLTPACKIESPEKGLILIRRLFKESGQKCAQRDLKPGKFLRQKKKGTDLVRYDSGSELGPVFPQSVN